MADSDAVVAARRSLGRQLAAHRKAAGYSQASFAPVTTYARSTVANVETGRQHVPRTFWERADAALHTNLTAVYDELTKQMAAERREQAKALEVERVGRIERARAERLGSTADELVPLQRSGEMMSAEPADAIEDGDVLAGLLGERLAVLDDRQPTPALERELLDTSVAAGADRLLRLFLQLDAAMGGDDLYQPMTRHVERLARAANENSKAPTLQGLGQLSQMTGWLALDGNKHGAARRYFTTAVFAANETDDPALAASSLAYLSLQATYRDNPKRAQALAATAMQVAGQAATPFVQTMLATRLARAHAKLGNRQESLAALGSAQDSFTQAGRVAEPLWISYVDEIEVQAQAGACYLDLGLHDKAETALTQAVTLLRAHRPERARDHVHYLSRLAKCRLLAGDAEHACQTGMQALNLALVVGSARVIERIGEFDAALNGTDTGAARDFRERFALFRRSR